MDDDKPFTCDLKGCTQKFANSDHLELHRQKHLNVHLGYKTSESIVDQTPTPTRFLKNFDEESGLFADLENPFDQVFKKASAAGGTLPSGGTALPTDTPVAKTSAAVPPPTKASSSSTGDGDAFSALTTLSYVSSLSNEVTSSSASLNSATVVVINRAESAAPTAAPPPPPSAPTTASAAEQRVSGLSKNIVAIITNPKNSVPKAARMPAISSSSSQHKGVIGSSVVAVPTPAIVTSGSSLPNFDSSGISSSQSHVMSLAKQRLKESLQQHAATAPHHQTPSAAHSPGPSPGTHSSSPSPTNSVSTIDDEGDAFYCSPHSSQKRSRRSQDELDPDERRNKFLERNRAAASRCRQKRKIWVQQLEKRAEDLGATNSQLQNEISQLRAEVAQLKALLLAHKDCPITMQQQAIFNHVTTNGSYEGARHLNMVTTNGAGNPITASAEEVASSALTDMAKRATMEMENRISPTTGSPAMVLTNVTAGSASD